MKRDLEKQIKELTALIKQQLPLKMSEKLPKYLRKRFNYEEIRRLRANSYSAKGARTGKPLTTKIDVLSKSGLGRLKTMAKGLKKLGKGVGKAATMLNYGVVAYDAAEEYSKGGTKSAARTFITGASAIYLTSQAVAAVGGTTALGGLVIGGITGNAAAGATLLLCSPVIGWVIVVVVGVAVAGYVGYQAKGYLEKAWDIAEDLSIRAYNEIAEDAALVHDHLRSAWNSGSRWVLDYYGYK